MARFKRWRIVLAFFGVLLAILGGGGWFFSSWLTGFVESDRFRVELEMETAKGLHFESGRYAPIRRTGPFSAASDRFEGFNGRKALRKMDVHGITAQFNPRGVFQRRWQLDDVHVQSGEVEIQFYEPKPEPTPSKPWYAVFLPERVYLQHVESEPVDVTWRFRGKRSGFFGTRLFITPHDRDFNYQATGGTLKMALIPELYLRQTHLLITKTELTLYDLDLISDKGNDSGKIYVQGKAGTSEDRSVDFEFRFNGVPIRRWLPAALQKHLSGVANGNAHWQGKDPKLEHSTGTGAIRLAGARIDDLGFLERIAELTKKKELEHLRPGDCSLRCSWRYPRIDFSDILVEEKGKYCLRGAVTMDRRELSGALELGVAPELLDWLPKPEEVFPRRLRGYMWTTVHLWGTIDDPKQDLSPRVMRMFQESPSVYLRLLFRALVAWLKEGRPPSLP